MKSWLRSFLIVFLSIAVVLPPYNSATAQTPILRVSSSGALSTEVLSEQRRPDGSVLATLRVRNLTGAWYLVTRSGGNFILANQVQYAFVLGPSQVLTFSALEFGGRLPGDGDVLQLYADRVNHIGLAMLAMDTLFRTFFGERLPNGLFDPAVPRVSLEVSAALLTALPSNTLLSEMLVNLAAQRWFDLALNLGDYLAQIQGTLRTVFVILHRHRLITDAQFVRLIDRGTGNRLIWRFLADLLILRNFALALELFQNTLVSPETGLARIELPGTTDITRLTVAPSAATVTVGQTLSITAAADGPINPAWRVEPATLGSLSSTQGTQIRFTGSTPGSGRIIASQGPFRGTVRVTVQPAGAGPISCRLARIDISPASVTLEVGESRGFVALGTCLDGRRGAITANWSVTGGVGAISLAVGTSTLFSGTAPGTGMIRAAAQGITGSAQTEVIGSPPTIAEWPMYLANAGRTAFSAQVLVPPLSRKWSVDSPVPPSGAAEVVSGGLVLSFASSGPAGARMQAWEVGSGARRWASTYTVAATSVVVSSGNIYSHCASQTIPIDPANSGFISMRLADGTVNLYRPSAYSCHSNAFAVWQGLGFTAYTRGFPNPLEARLVAIRLSDGSVAWERIVANGRAGDSLAITDGTLYFFYSLPFENRAFLQAVRVADGTFLWSYEFPAQFAEGLMIAVSNGRVFANFFPDSTVRAFNAQTGALLWQQPLPSLLVQMALSSTTVYTIVDVGRVSAFDAATGVVKWTQHQSYARNPVLVGDVLYVLCGSGDICSFQAGTGARLTTLTSGYPLGFMVAGNGLLVTTIGQGVGLAAFGR